MMLDQDLITTTAIPYFPAGIPDDKLMCFEITGDCLEGANVPDGALLVTVMGLRPQRGDIITFKAPLRYAYEQNVLLLLCERACGTDDV